MHSLKRLLPLSLAIALSLYLITIVLHTGIQRILAQKNDLDNNSTNNNTRFLTYSNLTSGIKILYPSYWQNSESNNSVIFTSPLKTIGVKFVIIPSANMSLDEFTVKRIAALRGTLTNFSIDRSHDEVFLYSRAQTLVFTYGNGYLSKVLQAWTIKDNKAYIITYYADAVLFDTFLPTALKIINSLRVGGINR